MIKPIKQCAGVDCSKKDFTVTFSICDSTQEIHYDSSRKFVFNEAGLKALNKWIGKRYDRSLPFLFVMEATGVYHERLAHFLYDLNYPISIVLPKRAKDFSKTLKVKKVNDKIASRYLATMGLEKKLDLWQKPERIFYDLKLLTRECDRIQAKITEVKNEMEAESFREWSNLQSQRRLMTELKLLKKQKAEVMKEIKGTVDSKPELKEKIRKIITIPGVGLKTAVVVIGETNGFSQVNNKRQLVSYAGYDVMNQESGTSVKTKARISKKGNKHIRKAMHMPALASIRHGDNKDLFVRIVSKTGIKMKGVVAAQRKLLVLIYTLWKNGTEYDPDYEAKNEGDLKSPHELDIIRS